jgi:hypothetical protein
MDPRNRLGEMTLSTAEIWRDSCVFPLPTKIWQCVFSGTKSNTNVFLLANMARISFLSGRYTANVFPRELNLFEMCFLGQLASLSKITNGKIWR